MKSVNSNLPQKYNDGILKKFFNKIRSIFYKKKDTEIEEIQVVDDNNKNIDFRKQLEVKEFEKNPELEKKKLFDQASDNPEYMKSLPITKLKVILQYYLNENEKKRALIKRK